VPFPEKALLGFLDSSYELPPYLEFGSSVAVLLEFPPPK